MRVVSSVPTYDLAKPTDPTEFWPCVGRMYVRCPFRWRRQQGGKTDDVPQVQQVQGFDRIQSRFLPPCTLPRAIYRCVGLYTERLRAWASHRRHLSSKVLSCGAHLPNSGHRAHFWALLLISILFPCTLVAFAVVGATGELRDNNALWNQGEREGRPAVSSRVSECSLQHQLAQAPVPVRTSQSKHNACFVLHLSGVLRVVGAFLGQTLRTTSRSAGKKKEQWQAGSMNAGAERACTYALGSDP